MITETTGLILKNTKIARDRRMLVLFTRKFGKISAGTGLTQRGKNLSHLALRPFTYGRYQLFKGRDYNVDAAEPVESFFELGEDIDKYFAASCALEYVDALLPYEQPAPDILDTLLDFFRILKKRQARYRSLLLIFQWIVLSGSGFMPNLQTCCRCGQTRRAAALSVPDGAIICEDCLEKGNVNNALLYRDKFDIIQILEFIEKSGMERFAGLSLNPDAEAYLTALLKDILSYHLNIQQLKSESYLLE